MTQKSPADHPADADGRRRRLQQQLDDALADSFPASDPVSIVTSQTEESWLEKEGQGAVSSSVDPA
jgi:hypothetical protein